MGSFSQRKGLKPVRSVVQVNSMDGALRNGLWNALMINYWHRVEENAVGERWLGDAKNEDMHLLFHRLWLDHFERALDTLDFWWETTHDEIREYFFACDWNEVYDLVERVAEYYPVDSVNAAFMENCNHVLESKLSAYRFVGGKIIQITAEEEIAEIEEALGLPEPLSPVTNHLKRGLDSLADRESPNYRDSIKESISAVEACCQLITGNPKATLGDALKEIAKKTKVELHGALKDAFNSLYGYTSDAEGIRHALLDEPNLEFEDAKFMLVSCSAFINYLMAKSSRAGIQF